MHDLAFLLPHWRRSFARPLLGSHDDEDLACVHAGSGSHDHDAPYLARQRCRGVLVPANTYGDRAPFRFGGRQRAHKERIEAVHAGGGGILPSFGPHGCVKPYCCLFVYIGFLLRSDGRCQTELESVPGVERAELLEPLNSSNPFLCCAWASFYTLKGSPTGGNVDKKGKNGKGCGRCSYRYCGYSAPYLTLTAGDKGIKCLSESPKQCKR